jgi:predicted MFS family arabinose efflux permease
MRLSLFIVGLGFLIMGLSRSIWLAAPGMALVGLGSFSFVPTLQAYLSNRLPYHQRARGLGILEYAWALSGIVGLYLVGQLLDVVSWQLPFFVIGGGLLMASLLYGLLPGVRQNRAGKTAVSTPPAATSWQNFASFFDVGDNNRSAFATIATGNFLMFGAFNMFVTYGTWLFEDFGLTAVSLGKVALVMGIADLCGSVSVSIISDRFGKRRSVLTGAVVACLGFWLLPLLDKTLITAVIGLFIARGAFEFAIVANMTLLSEQAPAQRAKLLTLGSAFSVVSTGLAGLTGPWAFEKYGLLGMTAVSGTAIFLSILVLLWGVREPETADHTKQS